MHIPRTHSLRRACSIYVHCRRGDWRRGGRRETRPKKTKPHKHPPSFFFAPPCSTDYSTIRRALAGQDSNVLPHDHGGVWGRESPPSPAHTQIQLTLFTKLDTSLSRSPRTACGLTHGVSFKW